MTDPDAIGARYLEHLSDGDLRLLGRLAGAAPEALRSRPRLVPDLLDRAAVTGPVLRDPDGESLSVVSPFLVFAAAVHAAAGEVTRSAYVPEFAGPRRRVPVFAGLELTGWLAEPERRLFLAELLASYAHVASGSYLRRTPRGWRRRRWSELDPVRLAELLDVVPESERAGIYRRLGDLALFLTGVFPDATAVSLGPADAARLLRAAGVASSPERAGTAPLELFERLGVRWYRSAVTAAVVPTDAGRLIGEVAESFGAARRVLNFVTDRYLFPRGSAWFPEPWA